MEIALPVDLTFADVLPTLLHYSGHELADTGPDQEGGYCSAWTGEAG